MSKERLLCCSILSASLGVSCQPPPVPTSAPSVVVDTGAGSAEMKMTSSSKVREERPHKRGMGPLQHEPCDTEGSGARGSDIDGDGNPEVVRVERGGREVCRAFDLDGDAAFDQYTYFDVLGDVRRRESDLDHDGRLDTVRVLEKGTLIETQIDMDGDGRTDTREWFEAGQLRRRLRDSDGDGRIDVWWESRGGGCFRVVRDEDGDGLPDRGSARRRCPQR